jgi:BON domain
MKKCPSCDRTYPDAELFCETDGTALVAAEPAFTQGRAAADSDTATECPVCGGKAQPGEVICNFCGARLTADEPAAPLPKPPARPPVTITPRGSAPTTRGPDMSSQRLTGQMQQDDEVEEGGRGIGSLIGYLLAAVIALGGGAWLALHLSSSGTHQAAEASPAAVTTAAPAPAGPIVALASSIPVQSSDTSSLAARTPDAARKVFDDHKQALIDAYTHALASDSTISDGMIVRVVAQPSDGTISSASVRTSTNPNPSLDAAVVNEMMHWSFPATTGGPVNFDYPIVFAQNADNQSAIESQLKTKLASLNAAEPPEYSSAPGPSPAGSEAAGASPGGAPSMAATAALAETPAAPPPLAVMPSTPVAAATPHHRPRRKEIARPKPTPTLQQRVKDAFLANRKLRRVDCYTTGGTVTIFGKVFDANDKALAERTAASVPGVTNVINSITTDMSDWQARQSQIAQQLYNAGLTNVTIKVIGHDAYLGGTVKSDSDKDRAVTIAESAAPVHVRTNLITVEPGRVFGF